MSKARKFNCPVPGCPEDKHTNPATGKPYPYCRKHLYKPVRDRDRRAYEQAQRAVETAALPPELALPATLTADNAKHLLIIDPITNRAKWFEVVLASPALAVVPGEPEDYGRFVRLAQEAGYHVTILVEEFE